MSKLWQNNCEIIYDPRTILKFGTKLKLAICNLDYIANISILLPLEQPHQLLQSLAKYKK